MSAGQQFRRSLQEGHNQISVSIPDKTIKHSAVCLQAGNAPPRRGMLFSQLTFAARGSASFIIIPPPLTPKAKMGYSEGNVNKVSGGLLLLREMNTDVWFWESLQIKRSDNVYNQIIGRKWRKTSHPIISTLNLILATLLCGKHNLHDQRATAGY